MADKKKTEETANLPEARKSLLPHLPSSTQVREIFQQNLEGIEPAFEVVKVPAGGGLSWTVPTLEGEESRKELAGVILDHYPVRAYWEHEYGKDGSSAPPACSSIDGIRGVGNPGGECAKCPKNEWQSGKDGRGKACRQKHRVFLYAPEFEGFLPFLVVLPTMSATKKYEGSIATYAVKLTSRLKPLSSVTSRLKLTEDKNQDGIKYSKVQFFMGEELAPDDMEKVKHLIAFLKPAMRQKPIGAEEYDNEDTIATTGAAPVEKEPWEKP